MDELIVQLTKQNMEYALAQSRFEAGRVKRAIRLLDDDPEKTFVEKYHTTIFACECPDNMYRMVTCKHKIALMISTGLFA